MKKLTDDNIILKADVSGLRQSYEAEILNLRKEISSLKAQLAEKPREVVKTVDRPVDRVVEKVVYTENAADPQILAENNALKAKLASIRRYVAQDHRVFKGLGGLGGRYVEPVWKSEMLELLK